MFYNALTSTDGLRSLCLTMPQAAPRAPHGCMEARQMRTHKDCNIYANGIRHKTNCIYSQRKTLIP